MPVYDCVCKDCNREFSVFLPVEAFEAKPRIKCPYCQSFRQSASGVSHGQPDRKLEDLEMTYVRNERRGNKGRLSMSVPCSVFSKTENVDECTTVDLGKGGIGIFSKKSLAVGDVIELQCKSLWDAPKRGTARWCQKILPDLYRIGIAFS